MQQELYIIQKLTKDWQAMLPMPEEAQRHLNKKIRLEFSYNSNHIEGNTLTYGETELLLIFGKTEGQHDFREYEEMEAHDVAFRMIQEWATDKERPLTEMAIKNLNETLLVKPYWKEALTPDGQSTRREIKVGDYKEFSNHVRLLNGEIFYYTSPADTPIQMDELMNWYRAEEETKELHPAVLAALLHYRFVRIHPFDDGNGRISRLLMNYVLLKNNLPPVIVKSADKKNYLFALNQADTGNTEAFITYVAEQLIWSLQLSIKAARGESLDEPGDLDKKLFLLKKKLGEDIDTKVKMKYGKEAINFVLENAVQPLANKWEEQLNKFDILFNTRTLSVAYNKIYFPLKELNTSIPNDVQKILSLSSRLSRLEEIIITAKYSGIRKADSNLELPAGHLIITFFGNTYEIIYSGITKSINKLYHQSLSENEIVDITEKWGNWFYEKAEQAMAE